MMAVNVGILSMQRIQNYGSFLQAYGLKHILEDLGCEVQFVDYHPGPTLVPADSRTGLMRRIFKAAEVLKQNGPLREKIRFYNEKVRECFGENWGDNVLWEKALREVETY